MSGAATPHSLEQYIQLGRLGDALKRLNDGSDCGIPGIDRDLVASKLAPWLASLPTQATCRARVWAEGRIRRTAAQG
jgi:hypothetical protein